MVAVGGRCLELATAGLFRHALLDLAAQVDGVILGIGFRDGFQKHAHAGAAVVKGFRDGNNLDADAGQERLIDNAILPGAGEAVKFMHKDHIEGVILVLCVCNHRLKGRALGGTAAGDPGVNINMRRIQQEPVGGGVALQLVQLCVGAELGLFLG